MPVGAVARVVQAPVKVKYCLYARKSMESEEAQILSIDSQIKEMLSMAERDHLDVVEIKKESHSAKEAGQRPVFNEIVDEIKQKKFNGILLDEGGSLAKNVVINDNSYYLIAYYGYPVRQSRLTDVVTDSSEYQTNTGETAGRGLVILNDKFQQVNYFYKLGYDDLFSGKKIDKRFTYTSKHFEIEYYPFAGLFNEKLTDRSGNHRVPDQKKKK